MFDAPRRHCRFFSLPLDVLTSRFEHAMLDIRTYYGRSSARNCRIIHMRLGRVWDLVFTPQDEDDKKAIAENRKSKNYVFRHLTRSADANSLFMLAAIWRCLKNDEFGLNQQLIDAMRVVVRSGGARGDDTISLADQHASLFKTFEESWTAVDRVLGSDKDTLVQAEEEHVRLIKEHLALSEEDGGPFPDGATRMTKGLKRRLKSTYDDWVGGDNNEKKFRAMCDPCEVPIDKLGQDESNWRFLSPKEQESTKLLPTGDDELAKIVAAAEKKATTAANSKKRARASEPVDSPVLSKKKKTAKVDN